MTTKYWTSQSGNAGIGDWYSTQWIVTTKVSPPISGDTAELAAGTVSITAADATTGTQGTLDGITINFDYVNGSAPTLDVSNVTFDSGMVVTTPFNNDQGVFIARGAVSFAGTLDGAFAGNTLTLDIEALNSIAVFTNTGTVEAEGGTVSVTGTTGGVLTSSGSILATQGGSLSIAAGLTNSAGGSVSALGGSITLSGAVTNIGTMYVSNSLNANPLLGGTIDITGSLSNGGNIFVPSFGVLAATGGLGNSGTLTVDGGTLTLGGGIDNAGGGVVSVEAGTLGTTGSLTNLGSIDVTGGVATLGGALVNQGQITESGGALTIGGAITGLGTITVTGTADIAGSVGAPQTIRFGNTDTTLDLGNLGGFAGTVANMTGHDVIDVNAVVTSTSYDSSDGKLVLSDNGTIAGTIALTGGTALNVIADGHGGTVLTGETIGTPTQVENYIVANDANTYNGGTPATHAWAPPIVYYTFDSSSTLSAADQGAFMQAMTLYHDMAGITFDAAGGSHAADLVFTTNSSGVADTSYAIGSPGIQTAATISIDTTVPGWTDLAALGTADTSGYGNYGFTTILHELGHAIGFGHPGPYNDTAGGSSNYLNAQIFFTDTRQYSVMSYIDAAQSGADYVYGGNTLYPQTPMLYDIGAAQQIYGANDATLNGNDIFGFHSTFGTLSSHPLAAYDFTQNTVPIVTFWDGGQNNTLDLSGFSAASTVDLAPGSFSSADTLVNNLAIAANTTIDSAIGGAGNDIFMVNAGNDTIDGGGGTNTVVLGDVRGDYSYVTSAGTTTVTSLVTNAVDTLTNVQTLQFADSAIAIFCFVRGTRILTARGPVPVEELQDGADHAVTQDGRLAPIRWIGWREVDPARHPAPAEVMPVRVRAGAIASGQPVRDLLLSPDHALYLDGVLVPVRYLLNGASIVQTAWRGRLDYYHVELDRHDVLLAEGLPAESFLDTGNRGAFSNGGQPTHLHPDFALRVWQADACAELVVAGPRLAAIRARLAARAVALGRVITADPDLRILADGRLLRPNPDGVALPPGVARVRLLSRSWVPLLMGAASADPRRLGVAVAALDLEGQTLALDDARLGAGWHAPEPGWRWTDGDAEILVGGAASLGFRVVTLGQYWETDDRELACA